MAKARLASVLLAGCLLGWAANPAEAAPTVAQMLQFKPRQQGVVIATPTAEEEKTCTVELKQGTRPNSSGWILKDAKGQVLRCFFDSKGNKKIDIWSYYRDGVEVYREIDTNGNEKADQYRWLNAAGMKWGTDADEDGKIDSWRAISSDEAAHEAYLAVAARDFARLRALFATDADLQAMKLPAAEADKIRKQLAAAPAKFQKTVQKLASLNDKAQFERVEGAVPQCVPADAIGGEQDVIAYSDRTVMYKTAEGKIEWLHAGAMVQVGAAWRLTDAPGADDDVTPPVGTVDPTTKTGVDDPALKALYEKLGELDKNAPIVQVQGPNAVAARYYQERSGVLEQILARMKDAKEIEMWQKQLADGLSNWTQYCKADEKEPAQRLAHLRVQAEKAAPGSNLTAYVTFREMWSRYGRAMSEQRTPAEVEKSQREWTDALAKFVQQYPRSEETAEALGQLAMGAEFSGKDDEAKRWYQQIVSNHREHPLAIKAEGSLRRLDLVGRKMELTGPTLQGQQFDIGSMRGKVVVVYYWASYSTVCIGDFARLKALQQSYAAKGLEIVTVGLDEQAAEATRFVQTHGLNAPHLFQANAQNSGLNSPLALQYGINGLPSLILVGRDGNVINRSLQINDLEEAIRKAL